jgi:hypothetical protein
MSEQAKQNPLQSIARTNATQCMTSWERQRTTKESASDDVPNLIFSFSFSETPATSFQARLVGLVFSG